MHPAAALAAQQDEAGGGTGCGRPPKLHEGEGVVRGEGAGEGRAGGRDTQPGPELRGEPPAPSSRGETKPSHPTTGLLCPGDQHTIPMETKQKGAEAQGCGLPISSAPRPRAEGALSPRESSGFAGVAAGGVLLGPGAAPGQRLQWVDGPAGRWAERAVLHEAPPQAPPDLPPGSVASAWSHRGPWGAHAWPPGEDQSRGPQ